MNVEDKIPGVELEPGLPVMDREQIDMLLMVDDGEDPTALVRELFHLFVAESEEKLAGVSEVCAANDLPELRKIVHFVAGSAGNLGLVRLCRFYREIEHAIDDGRLKTIANCERPIRSEFVKAVEAFRVEFKLQG